MNDEQKVWEAFNAWHEMPEHDSGPRDAWEAWKAAWQAAFSHASATAEECSVVGIGFVGDDGAYGASATAGLAKLPPGEYKLYASVVTTNSPEIGSKLVDSDAKVTAFRNRFISERTTTWLRDGLDYEMARAKAETDANEYEQAFDQAIAAKRGDGNG